MSNYYTTYVERDLRQLINLKDLRLFHNFIRLCAGRVGSELNASAVSVEVGVSVPTIKTKTPKLYFYDVGLAAWLMGIIVTSYGVKKYI